MTTLKDTNESIDDGVRTAERVFKIGFILSAIPCAVILIMALIGGRERLNTLGFVIPLLALQCFFYLAINARKRSNIKLNLKYHRPEVGGLGPAAEEENQTLVA